MRALLDANVLYPAPLRDLLMQLALVGFFQARCTEDIHREWIDALLRKNAHVERARLERVRDSMNQIIPDFLIVGYERMLPCLSLPDRNDRHVLAAAIVGCCDVILTKNLKDFPEKALAPHGIEGRHPDDFIPARLGIAPGLACVAFEKARARLKSPPKSAGEYLEVLEKQELPATVTSLKRLLAVG